VLILCELSPESTENDEVSKKFLLNFEEAFLLVPLLLVVIARYGTTFNRIAILFVVAAKDHSSTIPDIQNWAIIHRNTTQNNSLQDERLGVGVPSKLNAIVEVPEELN
jgi:hypothetical protein